MAQRDGGQASEGAMVGAMVLPPHDGARMVGHLLIAKYWGDDRTLYPDPYEIVDGGYNNFLNSGINFMLNALIVAGSPLFNAANTYICVGDSAAAFAASQTDLQAATNKLRKQVSGIPTVATQVFTASAVFATTDANYAWAEWAIANASSGGTLLNRAVVALGTKTSASAWTATMTLSVA